MPMKFLAALFAALVAFCAPASAACTGSGSCFLRDDGSPSSTLLGPFTAPKISGGQGCLSLEGYGGVGDGTTDNITAWSNAVSALGSSNGCISVGPGKFKFSTGISATLAASQGFTLRGAGKGVTKFYWPNASGGLTLNRHLQSMFTVENLDLTTGRAGGGTALNIADAETCAGGTNSSVIQNVSIIGDDRDSSQTYTDYWNNGVIATDINNLNVISADFYGDSAGTHTTGISYQGNAENSCLAIVLNITSSTFYGQYIGLNIGTWAQGITVSQSNFTLGTYGIYSPSTDYSFVQLTVVGSQFNTSADQVSVPSVNGLFVQSNYFFVPPSHAGVSTSSSTSQEINISNNFFQGYGGTGGWGVYSGNNGSNNVGVISGNIYQALGVGNYLGASSLNWKVYGNSYYSVATHNSNNAGVANYVGTANPMSFSGGGTTVSGGATQYFNTVTNGFIGAVVGITAQAGTFSGFTAVVNTPPAGSATATFTLYINGAPTALTCTVASAAYSCSDTTHMISVSAGSSYAIQVTASAGAVAMYPSATATFMVGE